MSCWWPLVGGVPFQPIRSRKKRQLLPSQLDTKDVWQSFCHELRLPMPSVNEFGGSLEHAGGGICHPPLPPKRNESHLKKRTISKKKVSSSNLHSSIFMLFFFGSNMYQWYSTVITLLETNSSPEKIGHPKRKVVFQPSIFRCELLVSVRILTQMLNVWPIYLHLGSFGGFHVGKYTYHTLSIWVRDSSNKQTWSQKKPRTTGAMNPLHRGHSQLMHQAIPFP